MANLQGGGVDSSGENAERAGGARFGAFEVDFETGELRKHGLRIKIQDKPLRLLQALLERPGQMVTREELRARVWPSDVYVDFDRNLKIALNKLRAALCDSAESPRYIETLPRRGYRFIAEVEAIKPNGSHHNGGNGASARPASLEGTEHQEAASGNSVGLALASSATFVGPGLAPAGPTQGSALPMDGSASSLTGAAAGAKESLINPSWRVWLAIGLVTASLAAAIFLRPVIFPPKPVLSFHQRDWVLVSQFENRTGEPVLDGTVDFAVGRELSNSQFVRVVPPERVGDDLRLMKKPADTPLAPSLARELCLRDGGIRALITGRVEKIGTTYVLSAGVVDPTTDAQVAGVGAQAKDLNGILLAVRELSNELRASLGETLPAIQESNLKLEKVTTPSLHALQLYSQAMRIAHDQAPDERPIPLLEQALTEDPNFASAHVLLGYCYCNTSKRNQGLPHFEKAFQLADTVSERERLFIVASYYEAVEKDDIKATQNYEALVRLYPDDYWGVNNLERFLHDAGRSEEAAEMSARRADLRPFDFSSNADAWNWLSSLGHKAEARRYFERARSLVTPEVERDQPDEAVSIEAADAQNDQDEWNMSKALAETQNLTATYEARSGAMRDELASQLGDLYLGFGRLKEAQVWYEKLSPDFQFRDFDFSILARARGDKAAEKGTLRRWLARQLPPGAFSTAARLADLGMLKESRRLISTTERKGARTNSPEMKFARGALALAEGRRAEAVALLEAATRELEASEDTPRGAQAANLLAAAYEQEGRISDAIQTLQPLEEKRILADDASLHLYRLYLKAGDTPDAEKVRSNLLLRLAYADPDYPILVQLRKQMNSEGPLHAAR